MLLSHQVCGGYEDPYGDPHRFGCGVRMGIEIPSPRQTWIPRIACTACNDAAYCYRCSVVCVSVSLLDITVSCAMMAEQIEVPFGCGLGLARGTTH